MATDIRLDSEGDLAYSQGLLATVSGGGEVAQKLRIGTSIQRNTCLFNMDEGIDYLARLRQKDGGSGLVRDIRTYILAQPGVASIDSLSVDTSGLPAQPAAIAFSVTTTEGVTENYP